MTYIPRREITSIIPNKFEAIRVLALECRRLNDEIRAREEGSIEGKLTTLAVQQMLDGKVTYYDAKERREQERSEAMLSAAEGLLDIAEPIIEPDMDMEMPAGEPAADAPTGDAAEEAAPAEAEPVEEAPSGEVTEAPEDQAAAEEAETPVEASAEETVAEEAAAEPVKGEDTGATGAEETEADEAEETKKETPEA